MRFSVIFLGLMFMGYTALANSASAIDSDKELAAKALKQSSGRIVRVIYGYDYMKIDNICSATLVGSQTIITASHCFYPESADSGSILKILGDLLTANKIKSTKEVLHFDIDGVTSKNLGAKVKALTNDMGKIEEKDMAAAKLLINTIPQIVQKKIHPEYIKSAQSSESTPQPQHDIALAKLDRKLNQPVLKMADYRDQESIYLSGQAGKHLEGSQTVVHCLSGSDAHKELVATVGQSNLRTSGKRNSSKKIEDNIPQKLASYDHFKATGIIELCDDTIVRGFSGGPHTVVRGNEVYLVGVTSQMFESLFGLAGNKVVAAKVEHIKGL